MKKTIFLFGIFFFIDIIVFWNLWNTYFQQDEWLLFGRAIYQSQNLPFALINFASFHFFPLGNLLWLSLYKLTGINAFVFSLTALILHVISGILFFYFLNSFTKNKFISFIFSVVFLISFPTKQVVVWYAVSPFLIPCVAAILGFMVYLSYVSNQKNISYKDLIILYVLFLTSFLFREEGATLIPLAFFYIVLFFRGKKRENLKKFFPLFLGMILFILFRIILQAFIGDSVQIEKDNVIVTTFYNLITVPQKMLIQNIIELEDLWVVARWYTILAFPRLLGEGLTIITTIFELVVMLLFIPLSILIGYTFSKLNGEKKKLFIFSIIWILIASAIISPQTRRLPFLESRYLFFGNIGVLLLIFLIFEQMYIQIKRKGILIGIYIVVFLSFCIYSYINIQFRMSTVYIPYAQKRIPLINTFKKTHPTISNTAVFYIECYKEKACNPLILPFQSGVGQMLLVLYAQHHEKNYAPFFKDFYLWDWEAQGYKEINGYGFGYYRNLDMLKKDMITYGFLPEDIISYSYNPTSNTLREISASVRSRIINSLKEKNIQIDNNE